MEKIKKIVKYVFLSIIGLPIVIIALLLLYALFVVIYGTEVGYKKIDYAKSGFLNDKFLNPKIQNDISYIIALSRKDGHLEAYNYHDSTNIFIWLVNNDAINIKHITQKIGYPHEKGKTYRATYENMAFGSNPSFGFSSQLKFKYKGSLIINCSDQVDLISEQQTKNYYIMNCYFGPLAFGSNYKNNEIILYAYEKPKTNLAVFYSKGKLLIIWVSARKGLPPIRDNYLKEILKPSLFERGLN